ncbi:MAG: phage tail tape measure protein [Bacteroidales bacterium]|nr:phage tail tape measure protein [Bacteroidales bacterium]
MAKLPIGTEEWYRKSEKLKKLKDIQLELRKETKLTAEAIKEHNEKLNDTVVAAGAISAVYATASSAIRRFISSTQEYVDAYATLDDAMTNVSKYTGLTREEVKQLNEEFQKMDTRTPTEKLNALAADAGRLGITSKEAIKDFVEAADIINVALGEDLGEDAVKEIGKLAEMFGTTETMGLRGAMLATGSAINTLAQSSSASERYLMDFTSRLAGAANQAKISQANILGFASVLDQNKQQVEMSATALQKLLMNMFTTPEKYAHLAGMSVEEFADALKNDANEALISFLDTLNKKGGLSELAPIFKDLGLDGARASGVISVLASKIDDVREAQATANAAFAEGNSVINEAAAVNGNAAAQLDKAKKAVQDAKAALGEELLPVITQLTQTSASGLRTAAAVVKFLTQHKGLVIGLGVAYGALHAAQKLVIAAQKEHVALSIKGTAVGNAYKSVVMLLAAAKAKLAGSTAAATLAQKEFKAAFAATPWGAVIVAIGAVATGMGMLISRHRDAKKAAEEFNTEVAKEQSEAQYLFEKLKNAEKGTDDYREALEKLKEKYPEIIQKHLDEEGALRDVEQAYKDVIVQIKAKIAEQLKEEKRNKIVTDALNTQTDAIDELRKKLQRKGKSESFINDFIGDVQKMVDAGATYEQLAKKINSAGLKTKGLDEGVYWKGSTEDIAHLLSKSQKDMTESLEQLDKKYDPIIEDANEELKIQKQLDELYAKRKTFDPKGSYGNGNNSPFLVGIDEQIDQLLEKLAKVKEAKDAAVEQPAKEEKPTPPGSGSDPDQKLQNKIAAFEKKLQEFRTRQQRETMDGWEKTKQAVIDSYQKMIDEASELKLTDRVKQLAEERAAAIAAAGQQYLEKNGKILEDFSQKFRDWQKESLPDSGNEILNAVLGTEQKWAQRFSEAQKQMQDLLDLRKLFVDDNIDTSSLDALINKLGDEMNGMADLEAKDIQKTLEKYQAQTDDFIKAEQKSITDATLTETQRQKNAIEEKYRLEIEHIEKTIAARIAAYGEDDPEVKQLREKIQLLNQLKGQQLTNVDKAAANSGPKSVWQQLAEFDWSKMGENWQSALGLMSQGLQEFANAAFDIYGSIAQIQDNMMEAELQKTQKTYDAKSAALQRQLNQGVISQKAYDAKMQKLNEEKEKKERKLKHEQFAREKTANIIQATIAGVLAAVESFKNGGGFPWGLIPMAMSAATTALQIAAIASQPNPYYKGGYIRGRQYAVMGEQGDEWVASNKLLKDRETAAVIAALDEYQRGNRSALAGITFAAPDPKIMSQAVSGNGRTFAPSNQVTNNYYPADNSELLKEMKQMNDFLRDPMNRRAYISSKIQLEFEEQEREVREMARL